MGEDKYEEGARDREQGPRAPVDEGSQPADKELREVRRRLKDLQLENLEIKQALTQIAQANVLPGIIQNGFDNVIAELVPLRDLTPARASLPQPTADAVAGMLAAMRGVTLAGGSLGIREVNVPFIGQPPPQVVLDAHGQQGAAAAPAAGQANPYRQAFRRGIPS